jgi:hypothetical protein
VPAVIYFIILLSIIGKYVIYTGIITFRTIKPEGAGSEIPLSGNPDSAVKVVH